MKIILANRYFYPDQSATSRMVSSLAFSLARQGHSVTALASRHFHNRRDTELPARETIDGVQVCRLWSSGFGRQNTVGRAVDYSMFHLSAAAWWLANARRGDVCVVCTDPPLLSVTSALPAALRGGKLVNWIMDLFPETAMELGMLPETGLAYRAALSVRNWSLRNAALTLCPTVTMADHLAAKGLSRERMAIVPHWSDGVEIRPVGKQDNSLRREWGLGDAFVVGYSGNFGRAHEFTTLLDAAGQLRDEKDIRFLFIGGGHQRASVEAEVKRRGLSNILFKPFQPSEKLAESLSAADLHVVSLLPALEHCIIPSKFYGILAAGRPSVFIGDLQGEVARASREGRCGGAVAPGDSAGLAAFITRLKDQPALCSEMGENARRLMESTYLLEHGVQVWRDAIARLLPEAISKPIKSAPDEVTP